MINNTKRIYYNKCYSSEDIIPFKGDYKGELRYLFVYVVFCKPTNQYYVGQHVVRKGYNDPLMDGYKGSGIDLKPLKQKFNWYRDFEFQILEFCDNYQQLIDKEQYWILQYQNQYPNQVLNLASAFDKTNNRSSRPVAVINLTTGVYFSSMLAAAKHYGLKKGSAIRNANKNKAKCADCFWIYPHQLEYSRIDQLNRVEKEYCERVKDNIKQGRLTTIETHRIEVMCIETNQIFPSISCLMQHVHHTKQYITDHLYTDGIIDNKHYVITKQQHCNVQRKATKRVINLSSQKVYESAYDAAKELKIEKMKLQNCIRYHSKLNNEYWCHVDQLIDNNIEKTIMEFDRIKQQNKWNSHKSKHRRVICETTGEIFETTTAASKAAGYTSVKAFSARLKISNVCKDKRVYRYLD